LPFHAVRQISPDTNSRYWAIPGRASLRAGNAGEYGRGKQSRAMPQSLVIGTRKARMSVEIIVTDA